jgi:hypothetical protein
MYVPGSFQFVIFNSRIQIDSWMSREGKPQSVRAQDEAWPWHMRFGHLHLSSSKPKRIGCRSAASSSVILVFLYNIALSKISRLTSSEIKASSVFMTAATDDTRGRFLLRLPTKREERGPSEFEYPKEGVYYTAPKCGIGIDIPPSSSR